MENFDQKDIAPIIIIVKNNRDKPRLIKLWDSISQSNDINNQDSSISILSSYDENIITYEDILHDLQKKVCRIYKMRFKMVLGNIKLPLYFKIVDTSRPFSNSNFQIDSSEIGDLSIEAIGYLPGLILDSCIHWEFELPAKTCLKIGIYMDIED